MDNVPYSDLSSNKADFFFVTNDNNGVVVNASSHCEAERIGLQKYGRDSGFGQTKNQIIANKKTDEELRAKTIPRRNI